jgi:outer membrane lipoprotein-sorting protein
MSAPRTRADDLLETWAKATARPTPDFAGSSSVGRYRGRPLALVLVLVVLVLVVLATLAIGAFTQNQRDSLPSTQLADSAARAIATASRVQFKLTISTEDGAGNSSDTNVVGAIDFSRGRFSGTADGGSGGAPMLLFGGPSRGSVIFADGLFVQTEGQSWVHVPGSNPQLDAFMDPIRLSRAFQGILGSSAIDPGIRFTPCGTVTCRVITLSASPQALFDAETLMFGSSGQTPPADFGSTTIKLLIDPSSGFPVRMDTTLKAGSTTTQVSLELARLDSAPSISPPVP